MESLTFESKVTVKQAYVIMFDFLVSFYERNGNPDELGSLLGQLALSKSDKIPMDPAAFEDWLQSANKVLADDASDGNQNIFSNIRLR